MMGRPCLEGGLFKSKINVMMKLKNRFQLVLVSALLFVSCSKDEQLVLDPPDPTPPVGALVDGLNYSLVAPDADKELKITFKAAQASALYGYAGDVYIHTGVISEGVWLYVPAEWTQNLTKCKMSKEADNVWSITLAPSIREWFASGVTAVQKLGIVIRSADATKKGIETDSFVEIADGKYTGFVPAAVKNAPLPANVKEGINKVDNATVTLVLYDKDKSGNRKEFAHVVGDFNNWKLSNDAESQMSRDEATGCWWITLTGLNASKEYAFQYYVGTGGGETIRLADAYARKILDPDNDKTIPASTYPDSKTYPEGAIGIASVFRLQEDTYSWKVNDFKIKERDNLVIYEMLLRDFTKTGDLKGAIERLDYVKSLGVNAIELMPVQEFDGNNSWGYNPCFYFALDKAYGTDRMYKEFIDKCHEAGLAVILDVVYNHATGAHPFAKLYWDAKAGKTAANNPWFNVDAPHPYSVFHDFNHESPLVRAFVKRNLEFLLKEYRLDGFRFDLTKGFTQHKSEESTASRYDASRVAILADYHTAIKAVNPDACVIMEHFCDENEHEALAKTGMKVWRKQTESFYQSGMGYAENSGFRGLALNASMPYGGYVDFMESHDEERTGFKQTKWGSGTLKTDLNDRMKQLASNAAFFFTISGPKMIWQFEELGYDYSINSKSDGTEGTEGNRTDPKPVKWDYFDNAYRKGLYQTYSKLLALRKTHPELFGQSAMRTTWNVTEADWAEGRTLTLSAVDGKGLVVVGNFTDKSVECAATFPSTGTWYNYMEKEVTLPVTATMQKIAVPAHEFRIYTTFKP